MLNAAIVTTTSRAASDSFDRVVSARQAQVLRTAYRILGNWADAEDVAQDVFVRLHRHGLGFPSDAALGSWLYRVTVNLCLDRGRTAKPWQELPDLPYEAASSEAVAIREQQKQKLMQALELLPARERAAVVLREMEALPTAEVASILGTSEGTIRSQVSKAIARLREILTKEEER